MARVNERQIAAQAFRELDAKDRIVFKTILDLALVLLINDNNKPPESKRA